MIHDLAAYGVPAATWPLALGRDRRTARCALILALGEYPPATVPDEVRRSVAERLLTLYASDADPGIHSAIDWLFRTKWDLGRELDSLDQSWRGQAVSAGRNWFVNAEGVTMAVVLVAKPLEFEIGSPEDEDGRDSDERVHRSGSTARSPSRPARSPWPQFERFRRVRPARLADQRRELCPPPARIVRSSASTGWPRPLIATGSAGAKTFTVLRDQGDVSRSLIRTAWATGCPRSANGSTPAAPARVRLDRTARRRRFSSITPGICRTPQASPPRRRLEAERPGLVRHAGQCLRMDRRSLHSRQHACEPGTGRAGAKLGSPLRDVEVVLRGGSFSSPATSLRSAYRERSSPSDPLETYGFRYVRTLRPALENEARTR